MSIGEALTQARDAADLSVAEISRRTRIRETIIRGIERDDYSHCGGDFYARGHIRAIARAVGADPEPLIWEYDSARQGPPAEGAPPAHGAPPQARDQGTPAEDGPTEPLSPVGGARRRVNWTMALSVALLAAVAVVGYQLVFGSGQPGRPRPTGRGGAAAQARSGQPAPSHVPRNRNAAGAHGSRVVVRLTALRDSRVEFTTPGGKRLVSSHVAAGSSRSWTFQRAVDLRLTDPGAVRLTVDGKTPAPLASASGPITLRLAPHRAAVAVPSPSATPARTLKPASVTAFGVGGPAQGDNPQLAHRAIDGSSATAWHTDWYTTARFGNLYAGTGLLLDMGRTVTLTSVRVTLGAERGADLQVRVGDSPALAATRPVARASGASGATSLRPATPARGRYVIIWFTRLPPDASGTFQASVRGVRLEGRP